MPNFLQKQLRFLRNRPGELLGAAAWPRGCPAGDREEGRRMRRKASPGSGKGNKAQDKRYWGILTKVE